MDPYLTHFIVDAHAAAFTQQAQHYRLARDARRDRRRPGRLRSSTARLLVAVATRLDHRLQPAAHASTAPAGT